VTQASPPPLPLIFAITITGILTSLPTPDQRPARH
jgi:hypothetical protein